MMSPQDALPPLLDRRMLPSPSHSSRRALAALALASLFCDSCGIVNANATTGGPDDGGMRLPDGATVLPSPDGGGNDGSAAGDGGFCSGSGPVIPIPGAGTSCTGDLGARTFLFAVCACNDVAISGVLTTDALDSASGTTGKMGGSIGANGALDTNSTLLVNGDVWAAATSESTAVQAVHSGTIAGDVHAGAAVAAGDGGLTIGGDLSANGDVTGDVTCDGTATIPTGDTYPNLTADAGVVNAPVSVAPPCNCGTLLDIASIVSGFAGSNDDVAAGFTSASLSPAPATTVSIPCGRYYFDGITGSTVSLSITGRAAIFVDGDLHASSQLTITPEAGAQLDLFVTGNLVLEGGASLGSPSAPAAVRVYVGGSTFTLSGSAQLGANIYAPSADVQLSSDLSMSGSLFVGSLAMSGAFTVHYDESILSTSGCTPAGSPCQTCHDCEGATPACKAGTCTACVTDSDCCAPLHCNAGQCYDEIP
jgi:hypothetical protein